MIALYQVARKTA